MFGAAKRFHKGINFARAKSYLRRPAKRVDVRLARNFITEGSAYSGVIPFFGVALVGGFAAEEVVEDPCPFISFSRSAGLLICPKSNGYLA